MGRRSGLGGRRGGSKIRTVPSLPSSGNLGNVDDAIAWIVSKYTSFEKGLEQEDLRSETHDCYNPSA